MPEPLHLWQIVSGLIIAFLGAGWITQLVKNKGDWGLKRVDELAAYRKELRDDLDKTELRFKTQLTDQKTEYEKQIAEIKALHTANTRKLEELRQGYEEVDRKLFEEKKDREMFQTRVLNMIEYRWGDREAWNGLAEELREKLGLPSKKATLQAPPREGDKPHILFVDDSANTAEAMQRLLQLEGYEAAIALSGHDALQQFNATLEIGQPFDLILLDYAMPNMNGEQLAFKIRELETQLERPPVPLIFLTANLEQITSAAAGKLGAKRWQKPKPWEEIKAELRELFQ